MKIRSIIKSILTIFNKIVRSFLLALITAILMNFGLAWASLAIPFFLDSIEWLLSLMEGLPLYGGEAGGGASSSAEPKIPDLNSSPPRDEKESRTELDLNKLPENPSPASQPSSSYPTPLSQEKWKNWKPKSFFPQERFPNEEIKVKSFGKESFTFTTHEFRFESHIKIISNQVFSNLRKLGYKYGEKDSDKQDIIKILKNFYKATESNYDPHPLKEIMDDFFNNGINSKSFKNILDELKRRRRI